jgi:molybdopterin/thiamine biosynthesis adenylyltransferase
MLALDEMSTGGTAQADGYAELTRRNRGFVGQEAQARVRATRLLVAGCGLGSVVAEVAVRTGFEYLVLADGDAVAAHNLNRQVYTRADVGQGKCARLAERLQAIHAEADIRPYPCMLTPAAMPAVVAGVDVVMDSIDLLDVQALLALHREARRQGKWVLSTFTLGWGGAVLAFAPDGTSLDDLMGGHTPGSHRELFARLVGCFRERIPAYVIDVFHQVMHQLEEGSPCSGSQLGVSTYLTAALAVATLVRLRTGQPVRRAPEPIFFDPTVCPEV